MKVDFLGRVRNTQLPVTNGLYPLFEAISNSIHAIEETKRKDGLIFVKIIRDSSQKSLIPDEPIQNYPITAFEVSDNGIGFNNDNFSSFETSDSSKKENYGGKGVGRLLWLKAFDEVEIASVFKEGRKSYRRTFVFKQSSTGVEDHNIQECDNTHKPNSTIILKGFEAKYRDHNTCPRTAEKLARRTVEHFLGMFVMNGCPKITIADPLANTEIDLHSFFTTKMRIDSTEERFQLKKQSFVLRHLRLIPPQDVHHSLFLCAANRTVRQEPLNKLLANLEGHLFDSITDQDFIYVACIAGKILDSGVNAERTHFNIPESNGDASLFPAEVSIQDIIAASTKKVQDYLAPYTKPIADQKQARIVNFVNTLAPQYKPLLNRKPERLAQIRSNLSDQQLDLELYKVSQEWDTDIRNEYKHLSSIELEHGVNQDQYRQKYEKFLEEWNEYGISKLARYVVHRKATLDFLDDRLKQRSDGKYPLEDAIHEIIFPLKATSTDLRSENMNLWIIDEKLAYHYFLASDKPLSQIQNAISVNSDDRPDLLIFNEPMAFAETRPPFSGVVIIEFKRPMRNDYQSSEKDNPIGQVYGYIEKIRDGGTVDINGRPMNVPDDTPIYAYVICDITKSLATQASHYQLTKTPDSEGYFGYHRDGRAYIEVISFDKMVRDAKRRNQILFDKIGVSGSVGVLD